MNIDLKKFSINDFAIYISDYLRKKGIDTVLSGGACVCIYTHNKYLSNDLDFVLLSYEDRKKTKPVLEKIGFQTEGRHFKHEDIPYLIEFLSPPLSVGAEPVKEISKIKKGKMELRLLSPTDCVKDRLAAFYHWNDRQSLDQAILVCRDNPVNLKEIERWSKSEDMEKKFVIFLDGLNKKE